MNYIKNCKSLYNKIIVSHADGACRNIIGIKILCTFNLRCNFVVEGDDDGIHALKIISDGDGLHESSAFTCLCIVAGQLYYNIN